MKKRKVAKKDIWFERKLYGWGWHPTTWQGWAVTFGYLACVLILSFQKDTFASAGDITIAFVLPLTILTMIFVIIAYKKGEEPRWQWGKRIKNKK